MSATPLALVDGLTVADELMILHSYPRSKKDHSLANVDRSAVLGILADLVLATRVQLYVPETLTWFRRAFYKNEGGHRFRARLGDGAPPSGDELIDSFMYRIPGWETHDLRWMTEHNKKLWLEFKRRLRDRGALVDVDVPRGKRGSERAEPALEQRLRGRLKSAIDGLEQPDDHTGAVLLLGNAAQLFLPGSCERELPEPFDGPTFAQRIGELGKRGSLQPVKLLADALVQFRLESAAETSAATVG